MAANIVSDLMIPLKGYKIVPEDLPLYEAIKILLEGENDSNGMSLHPARAVLVKNKHGKIIGQIGHLDFLKALESKYNLMGDLDILARADISSDFLDSMVANFGFWHDNLDILCSRSAKVPVGSIMRPIRESIEDTAPLIDAIHKLIMWQSMRVLVTHDSEVVGVLRLADVFTEVSRRIIHSQAENNNA